MSDLLIAADVAGVAQAAAACVVQAAREAIAARGRFRIALAGGSTPRALHAALVASPGAVDWGRTDIFFGDERTVPPDDVASNYRMARETLLEPASVPAANVRRMPGEVADLDGAARAYEGALVAGAAAPWLDLVLLGMGADGHTASLFPGTSALAERDRLCVAVEVPQLATRRLTLTYPALLRARAVVFLIAGADKAEALREVLADPPGPGAPPAQAVVARPGPVAVFCDRAAARLLPAASAVVGPSPPRSA